jgi:outer membrane receptor protein involved in Fe transport
VPVDGDPTDLREITLPAASKNTFNLALGYDKGPIDVRLSGTYRDGYLDELGDIADEDRLIDDHFQLDLSAKYRVTDNIQLTYDWVNINNAKYFAYNKVGGRRNLLQYEEYSWTMLFGAKVNF